MPNSEPQALVTGLILLGILEGKSGARAGARLLGSWLLAAALPWPRRAQSMTQAALPTGHFDTAAVRPNPPSLLGSLILSLARPQSSLPRWAVSPVGLFSGKHIYRLRTPLTAIDLT